METVSIYPRTQGYETTPKESSITRDLRLILTKACNYQCGFCHAEGVRHELRANLDAKDYGFLWQQAKKDPSIQGVTLTGGEPFLRRDLFDIVRTLKESDAKITVVSNGSLIDKHMWIGKFIERINISLHTLRQEEYAKITQSKTELDHVLGNIALLRQKYPDLKIRINATVVKNRNDNQQDIQYMIDLAEFLDLSIKYVELYPQQSKDFTPISVIATILQEKGFQEVISNKRQQLFKKGTTEIVLTKIFCAHAQEHDNPQNHCNQVNDLFVTPDGRLSTCPENTRQVFAHTDIIHQNTQGVEQAIQEALYEAKSTCILSQKRLK